MAESDDSMIKLLVGVEEIWNGESGAKRSPVGYIKWDSDLDRMALAYRLEGGGKSCFQEGQWGTESEEERSARSVSDKFWM